MFLSHSIWVSIKMLESNIKLFFFPSRASGWQKLLWIDVEMQAVELLLSRLHHTDLGERAVPINNNDLIFFPNIADGSIFRANFLSDCKESTERNEGEKRGREASEDELLSPEPAPPWERAGWGGQAAESQGHWTAFPGGPSKSSFCQIEDKSPNVDFMGGFGHPLRR